MADILINSKCPNCGSAFDPDFIFGNLRMCKACKQWSVALGDNSFNENVMFRIIHFEVDQEQIKNDLYTYLRDECSIDFLKKITNVKIEKLLVPVREIGSGTDRNIIPLNSKYSDIIDDLINYSSDDNSYQPRKTKGVIYDEYIPRDKQKKFSGEDARSKDIITEDIDISKESIDSRYNILRDEYYRIIYLPVYRIHLGGVDLTWACYGLKGAYGLKSSKSFFEADKQREQEKKDNKAIIVTAAGAAIGFFFGTESCSRTVNEPSADIMSSIGSPLIGLLKLVLWAVAGLIIGLVVYGVIFVLPDKAKRKKELSRIFNE